jgi:fatty acid desaturase
LVRPARVDSNHTVNGVLERWRHDPRLSKLQWKDLVLLKPWQVAYEVLISLPWLVMEFWLLHRGSLVLASLASFFFFLTALRQVHGAFHFTLGIPRRWSNWFLVLYSGLMLGSLHAVRINHLCHHRHCLDPVLDIEGSCARMTAWTAIAYGPCFPFRLHREAFKLGSTQERQLIAAELALNCVVVMLAVALLVLQSSPVLLMHVGLMALAQCLTAFFAVWTVHHDCGGDVFARTQRGWLKNLISYDMFYHVEHHLFPGVPQQHLPQLAERVDKVLPELTSRRVF